MEEPQIPLTPETLPGSWCWHPDYPSGAPEFTLFRLAFRTARQRTPSGSCSAPTTAAICSSTESSSAAARRAATSNTTVTNPVRWSSRPAVTSSPPR